jgi:hypothetical protein
MPLLYTNLKEIKYGKMNTKVINHDHIANIWQINIITD